MGLGTTFSLKELRSAYRQAACKYHPDKNNDKDAADKFHKLELAKKLLEKQLVNTKTTH